VLKITSATGEGRIWVQKGEIVDAVLEDRNGKAAIVEMLGWKAGNFEILPYGLPRPRTIHMNYESLLMETAQTLDETIDADIADLSPEALLSSFARFTGVQFAIAVDAADKAAYEHWGCDEPHPLAAWIGDSAKAFRELGKKIQAGEMQVMHSLGQQRHLSVLNADEESLAIGFTRALGLNQQRETLKQIEAKWAF
jgi:hypothetical protein